MATTTEDAAPEAQYDSMDAAYVGQEQQKCTKQDASTADFAVSEYRPSCCNCQKCKGVEKTVPISASRVKAVASHPTKPLLALALHNGAVQLWDCAHHATPHYVMGYRTEPGASAARAVAFLPDKDLLAAGTDDAVVHVWDFAGSPVMAAREHTDYIRALDYHPRHNLLLSAGDDKGVVFWCTKMWAALRVMPARAKWYIMGARFHPKHDWYLTASLDCVAVVWKLPGDLRREAPTTPLQKFWTAAKDKVAIETRGLLGDKAKMPINSLAFHPNDPYTIVTTTDAPMAAVCVYRYTDETYIDPWRNPAAILQGHTAHVTACTFVRTPPETAGKRAGYGSTDEATPDAAHSDGYVLVSVSEDRDLRVWDLEARACLRVHRLPLLGRMWSVTTIPSMLGAVYIGSDRGVSCLDVLSGAEVAFPVRIVELRVPCSKCGGGDTVVPPASLSDRFPCGSCGDTLTLENGAETQGKKEGPAYKICEACAHENCLLPGVAVQRLQCGGCGNAL